MNKSCWEYSLECCRSGFLGTLWAITPRAHLEQAAVQVTGILVLILLNHLVCVGKHRFFRLNLKSQIGEGLFQTDIYCIYHHKVKIWNTKTTWVQILQIKNVDSKWLTRYMVYFNLISLCVFIFHVWYIYKWKNTSFPPSQ